MCGIVGFFDFNNKTTKEDLIKMTNVLKHRGSNSSGYFYYRDKYVDIGLGHRRLSILDLSSHGHQPMIFRNLEMVYNGEVYNFKEIREELILLGYNFDSDSDTEVILKAYFHWGVKAVKRFIGMFSIAIFDREKYMVTLIRDRAGVKPYYYYYKDNLFMFSSELKAFHKHQDFKKEINRDALALYLQYGYILQPHTIFNDCYKLKAGHYLEFDLTTQEMSEKSYWSLLNFYEKPALDISEAEVLEHTEKLLKSAFKYRMVSDVPVGIFLSGGYDSSALASILQNSSSEKLNMFTIGFKENGFNEAPYAKKVAEHIGSNYTEYYCTAKDALELIPKLPEIYDEPFGDSSAIPTILVSQLAKRDVTVALSADAGDEIFCGYNKYDRVLNYYNKLNSIPPMVKSILHKGIKNINPHFIPIINKKFDILTKYEKLERFIESSSSIDILKYTSQYLTLKDIDRLILYPSKSLITNFDNKVKSNDDILNQIMAIDYQTYLVDDILTKVDRATMSVGLEGREPFLDHRIIEFLAQVPSSIKYKNGQKKWILKEITHKYLPKELMDRPKKGFSIPLTEWFKDELKEYFIHYLSANRLNYEGFFDTAEVIRLRDGYLNGNYSKESARILWNILIFELWYEKWM